LSALPAPVSLRVLIAEDNLDGLASLGVLLRLWGHEVCETADGPAALAAAVSFLPDVAVLDLGLPEMDGYELAFRLRSLPGLDGLLLVAATGFHGQEQRAAQVGFNHLLLKPFEPQELKDLLAAWAARPRP
jgi:two-component system, chemotaxis family, CheB/CheR fusion protein